MNRWTNYVYKEEWNSSGGNPTWSYHKELICWLWFFYQRSFLSILKIKMNLPRGAGGTQHSWLEFNSSASPRCHQQDKLVPCHLSWESYPCHESSFGANSEFIFSHTSRGQYSSSGASKACGVLGATGTYELPDSQTLKETCTSTAMMPCGRGCNADAMCKSRAKEHGI